LAWLALKLTNCISVEARVSLIKALALGLACLPIFVFAEDNSCFVKIRDNLLQNLPALPEQVATLSGITQEQWARAPRINEDFSKISNASKNLGLEYQYNLNVSGYFLYLTTRFTSPAEFSSNVLELNQTIILIGPDNVMWVYNDVSNAVKSDCSLSQTNVENAYSVAQPGGRFLITKNQKSLGHEPAVYHQSVDRADLASLGEMQRINHVYQIRNSGLFGRHIRWVDVADDLSILDVAITNAPSLSLSNPATHQNMAITGVELAFPQYNIELRYYDSPSNPYGLMQSLSDQQVTQEQYDVPKEAWVRLVPLPPQITALPTMVGFVDADFLKDSLNYSISGSDHPPRIFNRPGYLRASPARIYDGNKWAIKVNVSNQPRNVSLVLWNSPNSAADAQYLKGSYYLQLDKVGELTQQVLNQIAGMNRLQAGELIASVLDKRLKYDYLALNDGSVDARTTDEILKLGTGVCQHYSAVFTAVARALHIPTRMIQGYALGGAKAEGHSWVEIKVNSTDWVPLDPQYSLQALPDRTYLPVAEDDTYELATIGLLEQNASSKVQTQKWKDWRSVTITKEP
jgi:transglutaminase-like putative cysteine protease